jgi:hypothetical protein
MGNKLEHSPLPPRLTFEVNAEAHQSGEYHTKDTLTSTKILEKTCYLV